MDRARKTAMMTAAKEFDGGSFQISYEWKEMLTYWEAGQGYTFDCAWGVTPSIVLVPAAEYWDQVVPGWMAGRRNEVLDRLSRHSSHVVRDDDRYLDQYWSRRVDPWRLRSR